MTTRTILVFASRDSAQYDAARVLARAVGGRLIDRLTADLEALTLVARHKIVEPAAVVVLADDAVLLRLPRIPTVDTFLADLVALRPHG